MKSRNKNDFTLNSQEPMVSVTYSYPQITRLGSVEIAILEVWECSQPRCQDQRLKTPGSHRSILFLFLDV